MYISAVITQKTTELQNVLHHVIVLPDETNMENILAVTISSASDNFCCLICKQFLSRLGPPQHVGPYLNPNCPTRD